MAKKIHFEKIGLYIKYPTPAIVATLQATYAHLAELGTIVHMEEKSAAHIAKYPNAPHQNTAELCSAVDCLIVVGGDGSLLAAAIEAAKANIPLIGINRGKVGFLSDIHPKHLSTLTDILQGRFKKEERPLLQFGINQNKALNWALNDVVLSRKQELHLLDYDVFIDQAFVCHQRSDGIIISSPTGSTAYALSAGGPIIAPNLKATALVPLCPHTLNSRPLVIPNTSTIDIHVLPKSQHNVQVHHDGHCVENQAPLTSIQIQPSDLSVTLMHPQAYDYFDTLKNKLHWEHKPNADLSEP